MDERVLKSLPLLSLFLAFFGWACVGVTLGFLPLLLGLPLLGLLAAALSKRFPWTTTAADVVLVSCCAVVVPAGARGFLVLGALLIGLARVLLWVWRRQGGAEIG
jgi:hypothetical protein